ncbi:hypothetical protein lerEdw1_018378 [Lerista edwardsae]|nr:hypothetical protein lerEdw1_018378 [Lerista edwardsae]
MPNTKETTSNDSSNSQNTAYNPRKAREGEDSHDGDLPNLCPPDSPPSNTSHILSMAELLETASEVSKMTIAHEIVVNSDFRLQEVHISPNSLEGRVKETLHKAFWDSLREQLSKTPPDYSQAIKLLQEIKETLLSLLLPWQTRLQSQIEEALDMELIKQEAEHGALDIHSLTTYILGTMAMLCAPVRDEELQQLRVMSDPIHLLREIFRVLDLMKMDMVNFTIQTLRPHLQEHSVQYERKKFQELLDKLPGSLFYTTEWLRKAAAEVSPSNMVSSSSTSKTNGSPVPYSAAVAKDTACIQSPTAVLNHAYMDLLYWEPGREYPETMLMDQARLHALQVQVNQVAIIAAVLLMTSSTCGSREVNKILLQLGYPSLSSDKAASLRGQLRSLADKDNAVRTIIEQRIQTFLRNCLSPGDQNSKDLPQSLAPVQEELLDIGQRFGHLIHHNRQVFGPYYSDILKKLLLSERKPEAGTDS